MKQILLLLGIWILAGVSAAQTGPSSRIVSVYEVTSEGVRLDTKSSRVVDTRSSLLVRVDTLAIFSESLSEAERTSYSADIQAAAIAGELALLGRLAEIEALDALARSTPSRFGVLSAPEAQAVTRPLTVFLGEARKKAKESPRIAEVIERAIRLEVEAQTPEFRALGPIALVSAMTEALDEEGDKLLADLKKRGIIVQFRIRHFRELDESRRYEVQALEPLSDQDLKAIDKIKTNFLAGGATTPSAFFKSLVAKTKERVGEYLDKLETEVDAAINAERAKLDDLRAKVGAIWTNLGDAKGQARADFDAFIERTRNLKSRISTLRTDLKAIGDQDTMDSQISKVNAVNSALRLLVVDIKSVPTDAKKTIDTIYTLANASAEQAEKDIAVVASSLSDWAIGLEKVLADLISKATSLTNELITSIQHLLGIMADMAQIGEAYRNVDSTETTLENNDGRLGGLSEPLVSGDEFTLNVSVKKPGSDEKNYPAIRFYAYKIGWRTDRLINIGFFEREDSKQLRTGVAVIDVFKKGTRDSLEANRLFSVGIGPSMCYLDQDANDQYEFGIGLGVSFLNDRVVGGYGYNTSLGKWYYFVGYRMPISP